MPAALELPALVLERPWATLGLLLPLAVWLLAARRGRPRQAWTGTLELWREAAAETPARQPESRRLPPAVRWLLASLVVAALGLMGPRLPRGAGPVGWRVVVDLSPSMYLPWAAPPGEPAWEGTRLERAIEQARARLAGPIDRGESVAWLGLDEEGALALASDTLSPEWLSPGPRPRPEPDWAAYDAPGTLWVTDAVPGALPQHAGLVACGGGAVHGAVAALGETRVEWDGAQLSLRPEAGPRPAVQIEPGLRGAVERVVRSWAGARGCDVVTAPQDRVVLEVTRRQDGPEAGQAQRTRCARDGWSWELELHGGGRPAGEAWLTAPEDGGAVVAWEPGQVTLAAGRYDAEPRGDPADFALSWSGLLDRAALPPAGVVPVEERRGAGAGLVRPGEPPAARAEASRGRLAAALAAASALLALAALGAGGRR